MVMMSLHSNRNRKTTAQNLAVDFSKTFSYVFTAGKSPTWLGYVVLTICCWFGVWSFVRGSVAVLVRGAAAFPVVCLTSRVRKCVCLFYQSAKGFVLFLLETFDET